MNIYYISGDIIQEIQEIYIIGIQNIQLTR